MNYPLISEYIESIKSAEDNFDKLSYLRPVLNDSGLPVMTSGNFAVVFKMQDKRSGKFYALKCFTKEQEGRVVAYHQIADALKDVDSPYFVSLCFLEKELFVDTDQTSETEFPVLLMDWVEGKTLDKYLREKLDDKYALEMQVYRFCQLAQWLIPQPFAHGDLKPDNIIVRKDGTLVLVDYDGMYVPAMKGQTARELGSPDFRHPLRTENDFDEHIDDFPLASILLSLKAISINPLLLEEYGDSYRLLLSEQDYRNISCSPIIRTFLFLLSIKEFASSYSVFMTALTNYGVSESVRLAFKDIIIKKISPNIFCYTKVNEENDNEWIEDERYVKYSIDGKKLLRGYRLYKPYEIQNGVETICDEAFSGEYYSDGSGWNNIEKIVIPPSVKYIGRNPFAFCFVRLSCDSPNYILEGDALYTADKELLIGYYGCRQDNFVVPEGVKSIGAYAFAGRGLKHIKLSSTVEHIGDYAFEGCQLLESIEMSIQVKDIGKSAFHDCQELTHLKLPNGLISIGDFAFSWCTSIQSLTIPSSVLSIGMNPFLYDNLTLHNNSCLYEIENKTLYTIGKKFLIACLSKELSFQIPDEVTRIGQHAFYGCPFRQLYIHDNIKQIGKDAFDGCYYEAFPYGYSMKILVSKGRLHWIQSRIPSWLIVKEIEAND